MSLYVLDVSYLTPFHNFVLLKGASVICNKETDFHLQLR